jgi:hypothetical protein
MVYSCIPYNSYNKRYVPIQYTQSAFLKGAQFILCEARFESLYKTQINFSFQKVK